MFDENSAGFLYEAPAVRVKSFTALVDGELLMFEPTAAFDRELAEDDDELLWLVSRPGDDDAFLREVARVRIDRDASHSALIDEYRNVRKWNGLSPCVRLLRHVAVLAYSRDDWQEVAAQQIGVTQAELDRWTSGEPPPEDLCARLAVFVPQLRNEAFRLRVRAEQAHMLLEFLAPCSPCDESERRDKKRRRADINRRRRAA